MRVATQQRSVITQTNKTELVKNLKPFQGHKQVFPKQVLKRNLGVHFPLTLAVFQ